MDKIYRGGTALDHRCRSSLRIVAETVAFASSRPTEGVRTSEVADGLTALEESGLRFYSLLMIWSGGERFYVSNFHLGFKLDPLKFTVSTVAYPLHLRTLYSALRLEEMQKAV